MSTRHSRDPFTTARLTLTLWYLLVTTVLVGAVNLAALHAERSAFAGISAALADPQDRPILTQFLQEKITGFERDFVRRLAALDLIVIALSAAASWWLSGQTLTPIRAILTRQQEFVADVSHELRTPLTTIGVEIAAYERRRHLSRPYRRLLDSLREELARVRGIVDGLLTLVRAESGLDQSVQERCDLARLTAEATTQLKRLASHKKLHLSHRTAGPVTVEGNRDQLKQIILVLLENAIAYTPTGGKLTVSTNQQGHQAFAAVTDTGPGIAAADLPRVFDRFFRGQHGRSAPRGLGLGLAIAKKLALAHHGDLTVASAPGQGSIFTLSLPLHS